ncbi:MAG TPA: hypothetical protein DCS93_21875 [Microscillaceae bacterium]|nr:hypothetical protein [Microscillaceae bacterium]
MKTLEDILYEDLVRTREHFKKLKEKRENNPQVRLLKQTVADRLDLPTNSDTFTIIEKLKSLSDKERSEKLKGIIT